MATNFLKIRNGINLKPQGSDPANGQDGDIYFNNVLNKYRAYSNGAWGDLGSGAGFGRNYLSDWFNGEQPVGTVTSGITATGNITPSSTWKAQNTSLLTIANVTSGGLREGYSLKLDHVAVGAAFVQTPEFTLDTVDLGKPVTVTFDHGAFTATDDYQVYVVRYNSSGVYQEQIRIAGTASATAPNSARIPAGSIGAFQGFFISGSTSTDLYALRFYRNNASDTTDVLIDTLYIGPQSVVQGAAVTDWLDATGLISFTNRAGGALDFTRSAEKILYRREGDSIFLRGYFAASSSGTGVTAGDIICARFSGLSIDFTKMGVPGGNTSGTNTVGSGLWSDGGSAFKPLLVAVDSSSSQLSFIDTEADIALREGHIANTDEVGFTAGPIPIVGWSSNVTMANRAVEEYFSNTGTTATAGGSNSATTSYYGLDGVPFLSIASTTANSFTTFDITLPSPAQPTDSWKVEMKSATSSGWIDAPIFLPQGTSKYGVLAEPTSATNLRVYFGNKGARPTNATYAGDGEAWSSYTTNRWRVRKVSGGASVGFPVSARNVVGDTSGTAVPSGFIGEKVDFVTRAVNTTAGGTAEAATDALATLTPGIWLLCWLISFDIASATNDVMYGYIATNNTSDNSGILYQISGYKISAPTVANDAAFSATHYYNTASSTVLYAKAFTEDTNATIYVGGFAVRIA